MVRIANRNDIGRIVEMELFVNRYNFKNIFSSDYLYNKFSYEHIKEAIIMSFNDMENNRGIEYYVLEDENIIKGYFSIGFSQDYGEIEIINFIIDVPFQNNKFGTQLMDYCMGLSKDKKTKTVKLNVFEKNPVAIKFYEKCGFIIKGKMFSKEWGIDILKLCKEL